MTFAAAETSTHDGSLVWLYAFQQDATPTRYANQPVDVIHAGHTYAAAPISHAEIEMNGELSRDKLSVILPRTDAFAQQFISDVVDRVTTLTIYRGHATDPDGEFVAVWKGSVGGAVLQGAEIQLECVSVYSLMRQPGLRARFIKHCRHSLYGRGCGLNRASFAQAGTLTAMSGVQLTVPAAAGFAEGWFTGGQVAEPGGILRYVISHAGSALVLLRPFGPDVFAALAGAGSLAVTLYPGCDRLPETCSAKFSNLDNHGGFPWIPAKNPMGGSSIL
jgi:uncharacterized phage protein (TIGR02218 family)